MEIKMRHLPPITAAILIIIGILFFNNNVGMLGNFVLLGIVIGTIPYILISYFEFQLIRSVEDQLPTFLLDMSEAVKSGLNLPEAFKLVSKTDYGKLSPEIRKISNQINWGIPVKQTLDNFSNRMKKSDMVRRIVRIINEAYSSGGDVSRTMETVASDIVSIKEAEKEKKSIMFSHVMVIYAIYFIFIGIIIALSKTLIPLLQLNVETAAIGGIISFQDPCLACIENPQLFCISCSTFSLMCKMFNLGSGGSCYYNALFLLMVIMQGIFSGLVAGQIGENSVIAGVKHSIIMTASGFSILMLLFQTGLI
jgi:flagellar protein FlaJ